MQTITQKQYESLVSRIYALLLAAKDTDILHMVDCEDGATNLVAGWMAETDIEVKD